VTQMSDSGTSSALQALDKFFAVVRDEASANPLFAAKLVKALGAKVEFSGQIAVKVVDPLAVAREGEPNFRATFLKWSPKDLKAIIGEHSLATKDDLRGKTKTGQLVDLMWRGAKNRLTDLSPG